MRLASQPAASLVALGALAIGLLLLASPAGASETLGGEWTSPSLDLEGSSTALVDDGAIHTDRTFGASFGLSAQGESVRVDWSWQKGERVSGLNGGDDMVRVLSGQGEETRSFSQADLSVTGSDEVPEAVILLGDDASSWLRMNGTAQAGTVAHETVVRVENNETFWLADEEQEHGFWYEAEGDNVHLESFDTVRVEGTFQVFLNNVSFQVEHGEEAWKHWTGYREQEEGAAAHYESRVTVVTIQEGTLTLSMLGGLSGYTDAASVDLDGKARASDADGDLIAPETQYLFETASLALDGTGVLDLHVNDKQATTLLSGLKVDAQGAFNVASTQGVKQVSLEPDEGWSLGSFEASAGGAVLLGALLVASRGPLLRHIDQARAGLRERRIRKWMQTGDRLTSVREFERAHDWYQRITDTYPNHAEAWYSEASALEELNRPGEAAEAYAKVNELIGGDDPELLDLAGAAAWRAGDRAKALELFEVLASIAPGRLTERIHEEGYEELKDHPEIKDALEESPTSDSYYV